LQLSALETKEQNMEKYINAIREAAQKGAQIICTGELFQTKYFCDVEDYDNYQLAESVPGPATEQLQMVAKELKVVIVCSLFEKRYEGLYHNTAAVIDADGTYLGKYRKMHIPDDPGFYEKFYFTPGDMGFQVFKTMYGTIGVLVCWDQWFPEAARIVSLMGAEIIFYPTAIGWADSQDEDTNSEQFNAWQTVQRGHAVANEVFVVTTNRTGVEGGMIFWGGSFVSNPFGRILYQASHANEEIHVHEIDLNLVNHYRIHWPFKRDRRIDAYEPILKRFLVD